MQSDHGLVYDIIFYKLYQLFSQRKDISFKCLNLKLNLEDLSCLNCYLVMTVYIL